jgi:Zn-dependent peptidase ImmA (M78 family)
MALTRSRGADEAALLRHREGLGHGHVDLAALAESIGITVVGAPWPDSVVEGKYVRRAGRAFVLLNSARPPLRRRFTFAHEIGHHCLVEEVQNVEFTDDETSLRQSRDQEERQANLFASALLMDARGVREISADRAWDDAIAEVSKVFQVSPEAAAIRLSELGLLEGATVSTFLEDLKDAGWRRRFRAEHGIKGTRPGSRLMLPSSFRRDVERLREAGVLSSERVHELLNRRP